MKEPHRFVATAKVACKRCGTADLHWVHMANALWRLHDDNDYIHRCKGGKPK